MKTKDLKASEFDPYYGRYIDKVDANIDILTSLEQGKKNVEHFFDSIPVHKLDFRYDLGKWSIKEILQHMIDTERVFSYRCFRIARHDQTPLAGFDQNLYILPSSASQKSLDDLLSEYTTNRVATISLIKSLSEENLSQMGTASNNPISARAVAFCIPGHDLWHMEIIRERYLSS